MDPGGVRGRRLDRPHPIVPRVVLHLGEAERLEDWRDVVAEAAAKPLLQPVPAAHRVVLGTAPGLDGAGGRGLLLIRIAQGHPVALLLEPPVKVIDAREVVAELGLAHLHHQRRRVRHLVPVRFEA